MGTKHSNEAAKPQQNRLIRMAQKRLGKYASVFPMVLIRDRAEYIHDIRVASRRMQQVMNLLFPLPRTGKGRKVVRSLRKVRRALGPCRNLDVNLDLIQEKLDTAGSEIARDAWTQVRDATMERRAAEFSRARDALKQTDIVEFISRVMTFVDSVDGDENVEKQLKQQTETAFNAWSDALASAQENSQGAQIHALRITGKRVRYSAELLAELGEAEAKAVIKSFKALQDELGRWHDLQVLMEFIAEFIGQPNFLLNHPDYGRYLLTEIEREQQRTTANMGGILENAAKIRNQWVEQRLKRSDKENH